MKDRIFLISDENYREAKPHLYGYIITDKDEIVIDELPENPGEAGLYIMVTREENDLVIRQDFCGSFGLFLWEKDEKYGISNSFFRLAEYLGGELHPDRKMIHALLAADEVPLVCSRTMAEGIQKLDSADIIRINLHSGKLRIEKRKYPYYRRKLKAQEDFDALDAWYFKWVRIIRRLAEKGVPLSADLSGGLDTRLVLSMLMTANVDVNSCLKLQTHTKVNLEKDLEDYRIAKEIAAAYGYLLASDCALKEEICTNREDPSLTAEQAYHASRCTSFGRSNLIKYPMEEYDVPVFSLKGLGSTTKGGFGRTPLGEVRVNWRNSLKYPLQCGQKKPQRMRLLFQWIQDGFWFLSEAEKILSGYRHLPSHRATLLYKKRQIENRDAVKALEWLNGNQVSVSPFFDPAVFQFDYNPHDSDILWLNTLMFDRYMPELLRFDIQGRKLKETTLHEVHELNRLFPVRMPSYPVVRGKRTEVKKTVLPAAEMSVFFENLWSDPLFRSICEKYVSAGDLNRILSDTDPAAINRGASKTNTLMAIYELECAGKQKQLRQRDRSENPVYHSETV